MSRKVLVKEGLVYIGSHCAIQLFKAGFNVFFVDNASEVCLNRLEKYNQTDY